MLDKAQLVEQGFGGILAVGKGSENDPRFIVMEHGEAQPGVPTICLVGKGLTFDSGGLSLKPADAMETMKSDMGGAAAVFGAMQVAAELKLPLHVVGLVSAAENMPSGDAYRPGDIVRTLNGKTIEVLNTDAEGRIILADALVLRPALQPRRHRRTVHAHRRDHHRPGRARDRHDEHGPGAGRPPSEAGEATASASGSSRCGTEYRAMIKSEVADLKNLAGPAAGSITAGAFLAEFVGDFPSSTSTSPARRGSTGRANRMTARAGQASASGCWRSSWNPLSRSKRAQPRLFAQEREKNMTAGARPNPHSARFMDKLLDGVERVGNKVPHPVLMFFYLILLVIVLSSILGWLGVSITEEIAVPVPVAAQPNYYEDLSQPSVGLPAIADVTHYEIQTTTIAIRPILSVEGIRFMFTSFVPTFQGFGALAITLIALLGAGAAEQGGLMAALIRKLVKVAPAALLAYPDRLRRRALQRGVGRRLPDPHSAQRGRVPGRRATPDRRPGRRVRRCRGHLYGEPDRDGHDAMLFEITNESLSLPAYGPIRSPRTTSSRSYPPLLMTVVAGIITDTHRRAPPGQVQPGRCRRRRPRSGRGSRRAA